MAGNQTIRRVLWAGVWWPTMKADVHEYVQKCLKCKRTPPRPSATLFQVSVAPKWSKYIVDYLEQRVLPQKVSHVRIKEIELESKDYELPKKVSHAWLKAIELESKVYELIENQLYKTGKDKQLRLCLTEAEYVRVLEQAHAHLIGGHLFVAMSAKAITMVGLWCPTLFKGAEEFVRRCDNC